LQPRHLCRELCRNPPFWCSQQGLPSHSLRFHAHVAVPLQHATADVTSNRHDGRIRCAALRKLGDSAVPEIVEPKTGQPRFLRQSPPSRPPAFDVGRRVKRCDVVADNFLAAECELWERKPQRCNATARQGRRTLLCDAAAPEPKSPHR